MKIAFFLCDVYQTYQTIVSDAMNKYAREHGITLVIYASYVSVGNDVFHVAGQRSIIQLADLKSYDGIIVAGDTFKMFGMQNELMRRIRKEVTCPVVSLRELENDYVSVVHDNKKSMYDMTNHFIKHHGFRDICFVTGRMEMLDAQERLAGFRCAMQEADIPVSDTMIFYGDYWRLKGPEIIDHFMQWRDNYPQAIVCSNDYMAFSVCEELKKRGVRVPEDVCVSGMDDLGEARTTEPQLTSIEVDFAAMATASIDAVVRMINGEKLETRQILVEDRAHFRSSCNCPDDEQIDGSTIRTEFIKFRYMTKDCLYMMTNYASAFTERECMEMTGRMTDYLDLNNFFICLNEPEQKDEDGNVINRDKPYTDMRRLCLHLDRFGRPVVSDISFPGTQLLPDNMLKELDKCTSFIAPIHYRKDVFGYAIFQLKDDVPCMLNERYEFLCIYTGIALNMIHTYQEIASMRDIRSLYLRDPLTNLLNRRGLEYEISAVHQKYGKKNVNIALASIDMDGLKYINDNFGHSVGDEALCSVAMCISGALNKREFCARLGGDEFVAVLFNDERGRMEDFRATLKDMIADVNKSITEDYVVDISVGICVVKNNEEILESFQIADELMYKDKRSKTNKQGRES